MSEKELRRVRLSHLLSFAFAPIAMVTIVLVFGEGTKLGLVLPLLPYLVSGYRLGTARCPECHEHFFWSFERGSNPLAHQCMHCRHQI